MIAGRRVKGMGGATDLVSGVRRFVALVRMVQAGEEFPGLITLRYTRPRRGLYDLADYQPREFRKRE